MSEGGIGLLLVAIFGVGSLIHGIYDVVLDFPPDWNGILRIMIPTVAFTTWAVVRVWKYRSKPAARALPATRGFAVVVQNNSGITAVGLIAGENRRRKARGLRSRHAKVLIYALMIGVGLVFLLVYFFYAGKYTLKGTLTDEQVAALDARPSPHASASPNLLKANDETRTVPSANPPNTEDSGGSAKLIIPSRKEAPTYFLPLFFATDFYNSLDHLRGGRAYVVDADREWLEDQIIGSPDPLAPPTKDDVPLGVKCTQIFLLLLLALSAFFLTMGTTLMGFLPKRGFEHEDAVEAIGSNIDPSSSTALPTDLINPF